MPAMAKLLTALLVVKLTLFMSRSGSSCGWRVTFAMSRENFMTNKSVSPSTMTGIKRLANQIKSAHGLSHGEALKQASIAAGYANFRHAQNSLPDNPPARPNHQIYLTAYWRDTTAETSGRETLIISLRSPWTDLLSRSELGSARGLENFRPEGPDHLCRRNVARSQDTARESVCHAARTLQFVEATRLRPSSGYSRAYPKRNGNNNVPGQDHVCVWFDDEKRYLIADEPYENSVELKRELRSTWCKTHGYSERKPNWPGMHYPFGGTRLYLLSDNVKGVPLEPVLKALERLPAPHSSSDWIGESASRLPYFVSPGSVEKNNIPPPPRSKPKTGTAKKKPETLEYIQTFAGARRRPNGIMPIPVHREVGRLLKEVLVATHNRKSVYNRVDSVRSDLDEWTMREYDRSALPDEEFFDLYYHESGDSPRKITAELAEHCIANLQNAKQLMLKHYPDSAPLRRLLKFLDKGDEGLRALVGLR